MTARAARLQREAEQAAVDASARRMDAETSDYKLPSHTLPAGLEQTPVRERDRIEARRYRDEFEIAERAEREQREAPVRAAEVALKENSRKLAMLYRERLTGDVIDPDKWIDPAVATVKMSVQQADVYNREQSRKFCMAHPEIAWSDDLVDALGRYFAKNGLKLISAPMIEQVVNRFSEAGLLPERLTPETTPEPAPEPQPVEVKPITHEGIDPDTGLTRTYSDREVNRMSSDQFRRAFAITSADLELPRIGPGPHGRR